jgi:hypothetical protein
LIGEFDLINAIGVFGVIGFSSHHIRKNRSKNPIRPMILPPPLWDIVLEVWSRDAE